jgi:hypothetical protein
MDRAALLRRLEQQPGQHLVIVRYGVRHNVHAEWVYNRGDIDDSKVVWAREMDPAHDQELLDYFHNRRVWLLEPDKAPNQLLPFPIPDRQSPLTVPQQNSSASTMF